MGRALFQGRGLLLLGYCPVSRLTRVRQPTLLISPAIPVGSVCSSGRVFRSTVEPCLAFVAQSILVELRRRTTFQLWLRAQLPVRISFTRHFLCLPEMAPCLPILMLGPLVLAP